MAIEKIVRIGSVADQDEFRRDDIRRMSPNERVAMVLAMQRRYFNWDANPKIERVARIRRFGESGE